MAVVHDQNDLTKIYEIVPIRDYQLFGSSKENRAVYKRTKKKYETILKKLAQGGIPVTKTEKKVASMYKNVSRETIRKAAFNIRVQIGQKERFRQGVIQSGVYIRDIKKIFRAHGMPEDLAYLPHVESSFNIKAHSKHGAAGIWQFTRPTGKNYLRIDFIIDDRLDPIQSSRAAAVFLKQNYKDLHNWPLAITAYNYGPAGMRRAVKTHGGYEMIFKKYNKGYFKFASRNFYPEFIAAVNIAKKLERKKSIQLKKPTHTVLVKLKGFISAADICHHFQIDVSTLKRFNPSLLQPILTGKKYIPKGYTLKLPARKSSGKGIATLPNSYFKSAQRRSRFYRVTKGDTASEIALMHRVSLKSLLAANNLKKSDYIYAGKKLRIPSLPVRSTLNHAVPILAATTAKTKNVAQSPQNTRTIKKQTLKPVFKMKKKKSP